MSRVVDDAIGETTLNACETPDRSVGLTGDTAVALQQVDLIYRRYPQPRDALLEWLLRTQRHEKFYALRDINLRLQPGDSLGIVGDNGAGKSTLLRLLAGNLAPSQGQCMVNGRRSALLELGSGLNPEFSGIENARVGLALRGLSQQEISQVLPDVLAFAELGEFVQQPVKNYSSGMVVRLVFAIAAVIEPDVLIVDEALSVGDQYFQKKSLDRMREILAGGATLVFCSHNLYQLREICQQAVWLERGQIRMLGEAQQVVDAYQDAVRARCSGVKSAGMVEKGVSDNVALNSISPQLLVVTLQGGERKSQIHPSPPKHRFTKRSILKEGACEQESTEDTEPSSFPHFQTGQRFTVLVQLDSAGIAPHDINVGVVIRRNDEVQCYGISTLHDGVALQVDEQGNAEVRFIIDSLPLLSGEYCLEVWLIDGSGVHVYDARERCCPFRVQQASQALGVGMNLLPHRWETGQVSGEKRCDSAGVKARKNVSEVISETAAA